MAAERWHEGDFAPIDKDLAIVRRDLRYVAAGLFLILAVAFRPLLMGTMLVRNPALLAMLFWFAWSAAVLAAWTVRVRSLLGHRAAGRLHEQWLTIPRCPAPLIRAYLRAQAALLGEFWVTLAKVTAGLTAVVFVVDVIAGGASAAGAMVTLVRRLCDNACSLLFLPCLAVALWALLGPAITIIAPVRRRDAYRVALLSSESELEMQDELTEVWDRINRNNLLSFLTLVSDFLGGQLSRWTGTVAGGFGFGVGGAMLLNPMMASYTRGMAWWVPWSLLAVGAAATFIAWIVPLLIDKYLERLERRGEAV